MKNFWISIRITLAMCLLLGVGYVLVLRGVSAVAGPGGGQAETLTFDGRTVGAANVGQQFTDTRYFWGRPSAVDYNGGGSGGSNKAATNPEYLAEVERRVQDFLAAHPYLTREEVPSEMVTASGSGLDPDISPRGAQVQVRRVAEARGLDAAAVRHLVDSLTQRRGWDSSAPRRSTCSGSTSHWRQCSRTSRRRSRQNRPTTTATTAQQTQ